MKRDIRAITFGLEKNNLSLPLDSEGLQTGRAPYDSVTDHCYSLEELLIFV